MPVVTDVTRGPLSEVSVELVEPRMMHVESYATALTRGWSPDTNRPAAAHDELARISLDAAAFVAEQADPHGAAPPITLPDGTIVARLPSYRRWMWDGEFAGSVSLRWQPGTTELPPHCLGHVGYSVVPWKRQRGYATEALRAILPLARDVGLPFVELTTDVTNVPSQRVILANGGVLFEEFTKPESHGGGAGLRYRIRL
jgi:predicted acetyltransferase